MKEMTSKERILFTLKGKAVDKAPVGGWTSAGVVDFMDVSGAERPKADSDAKTMADLAKSAHNDAEFDAVRVPYDIAIVSEVMGCEIDPGNKASQPSIKTHPFSESMDSLSLPKNLLEKGRIPVLLKAIEILKEEVGDEVAVIAGCEGPTTLASNLSNVNSFMRWIRTDRDRVEMIMDISADACLEVANACFDHGADAFVFADPVASPDLVSPEDFEALLKPRLSKIAKNLNGYSALHICGKTDLVIPHMVECGFTCISIEEKVKDTKTAVEIAHENNTLVIGNVSSSQTLFSGTPEEVKKEATESLNNGIDLLNAGCGVAPKTPLENLKAMAEARDEYFENKDVNVKRGHRNGK
ncbi:MtaA/CmuA family methyltransferase [Methanohalophilus sp. RSK]|uniref:methylcobamide:CoM methyltransferase MtaA n=1 Tax=Methanohalophilus sp. RSK TaxID=2485783 RepID=UPI000F439901|nr:methylcobamide:CoM methyltransferase MtaA [Methanohalophilus sp. RSK]RNI12446.1 MtaA/CmuA family methyltransferase [Methanohalophilus sp. RSK]